MKTFKLLLTIGILSMTLIGCLQVDTKVNLKKDGSGTIEETVLIKKEILNMLKEFAAAFDSTKSEEEFKMFNEAELKNKATNYGTGVSYKSGEKISKDGLEGYKVVYSFEDVNKIKLNPSPDTKLPVGETEEETPEKEIVKFNFTKGSPAKLTIIFPEEKFDEEMENENDQMDEQADTTDSEQLNKLVEMFDGMKIKFALKVDGDVKETDASYVDGNQFILLDIDFAEIINNKDILEKMEKSKQMTREDFKEMTNNIPGIKVETKEHVTIKFN